MDSFEGGKQPWEVSSLSYLLSGSARSWQVGSHGMLEGLGHHGMLVELRSRGLLVEL